MDVKNYESCILPTKWGDFEFCVWQSAEGKEPIALKTIRFNSMEVVTVRIHSECITGDIFSSLNCDCGYQKDFALDVIQKSMNGVFIYDRQEGRGIGLYNKIKALNLQKKGFNTYEANRILGFKDDERDYGVPIAILKSMGIERVRLITNNPKKISALSSAGIKIVERIAVCKKIDAYNSKYLKEKQMLGDHMMEEI